MSETLIAPRLRWVKLDLYCQASGDTPDAVHARRRRRQWVDGVHCRVAPDGNLWVCPEEVNRWIEQTAAPAAPASPAAS